MGLSFIGRESAILNRLAAGMRAHRERDITGGELDEIIMEAGASLRAIERDRAEQWQRGCAMRQAVREGRALWL